MNKKRLDVRRIHLGITPKADAKQKIEAALTDEIEMKLNEADKAAAADSVRYKENEVFSRRQRALQGERGFQPPRLTKANINPYRPKRSPV